MLTKLISTHPTPTPLQKFIQNLGYTLKPQDSTIPDRAYIVSFSATNNHFLLAIRIDASSPIACLKDGQPYDIDKIFINNEFGQNTIRQSSSSLTGILARLGTHFDIELRDGCVHFCKKTNDSRVDYQVTRYGLLHAPAPPKTAAPIFDAVADSSAPQLNPPTITTMRCLTKPIGKEACVGEIKTEFGAATCVLLEDGSVLMNFHLVFDIDRYVHDTKNPRKTPDDLRAYFCDFDSVKAVFANGDIAVSCSFDGLLGCGLSLIQQAQRGLPENWDFAVFRPIGDLRELLGISGLTFSQWDHTSITNMVHETLYIYAPSFDFEQQTYSYRSQVHAPSAVNPQLDGFTAVLPDHEATRSFGSSGSIALQGGDLFLFNFQRDRLLPAVHLKHDILRAISQPFDPFHMIDLSSVDTRLLTKLKSNVIKQYQDQLPPEFGLDNPRVKHHFNQLIHSSESKKFSHFLYELKHDCATKSIPDAGLTTQELYLTTYGWKARAEKKIPLDSAAFQANLVLYRVIKLEELPALAKNQTEVLHGHMGDFKQALCYLYGQGGGPRVLMEFEVNAKAFFSPQNIALPNGKKPTTLAIKKSLESEYGATYALSYGPEGRAKDDKFGMKEEAKGDVGFSITFSTPKTHERLADILVSMKPVLWNMESGESEVTAEGLAEKWGALVGAGPPLTFNSV